MHVGLPSAGAPLPTPARFAASCNSIAPAGFTANSTTSGDVFRLSQRRVQNRFWSFGQPRDLRHLFRLHISQIEHHLQRLFGFFFPLRRKRDVVRVRPYRAIEMVLRYGIKRLSLRRQPPEAAAGRLRALELLHVGWSFLQKCDGHRLGAPPWSPTRFVVSISFPFQSALIYLLLDSFGIKKHNMPLLRRNSRHNVRQPA